MHHAPCTSRTPRIERQVTFDTEASTQSRTHTFVDSPLGELALVAEDGALFGLYFPHHCYKPDPMAFGVRTEVEQAWIGAYSTIADLMLEGAASAPAGCNATNESSVPEEVTNHGNDRLRTKDDVMMHETCFCGWSGELADREPVSVGNSTRGLACPACGHLDCLEWLRESATRLLLEEATRRQHERARGRSQSNGSIYHALLDAPARP